MKTSNFWATRWSSIRKQVSSWSLKQWIFALCPWIIIIVLIILVISLYRNPTRCRIIPLRSVEQKFHGEQIGTKGLRYKYGDRIYDPKTEQVLVDSIDWLHISYGDTIAILAKNDKRAYINLNTAKLLTPLIYDKAWEFACGRGVMMKGDSVYIFRRDGSIVQSHGFFCECPYELTFHKNRLAIRSSNSKEGLLDTAANWVLEPIYKEIRTNYHHDLYNTRLEDKCIVYDLDLKPILQGNFKQIEVDWSEGLIATEHNGIQHLYSYEGKMICNHIFKSIEELNYKTTRKNTDNEPIYEETECLIYVDYDGKKGLMDKHYNVLTPPMFTNIEAQTRHIFFASFGEYYDRFGTLLDDHGKQIR